jgi:hypothetical protein
MAIVQKTPQEIKECIEFQKKYCSETGHPHFAPETGNCFRCHKNVYQNYDMESRYGEKWESKGYGKTLVTGCPHCKMSYCE